MGRFALILIHFDTFAVMEQSPLVEIENSMTAFLKKLQGYSPNGKGVVSV
jgi:hypothetical protein